jgi:hypothetical protein
MPSGSVSISSSTAYEPGPGSATDTNPVASDVARPTFVAHRLDLAVDDHRLEHADLGSLDRDRVRLGVLGSCEQCRLDGFAGLCRGER